jgi:hypothetical protein
VVVGRVPLELPEEVKHATLPPTGDVFSERLIYCCSLRPVMAETFGFRDKSIVEREARGHRDILHTPLHTARQLTLACIQAFERESNGTGAVWAIC